ncbi:MAG TPA: hypothetical protein PK079_00790 [Leptospiraceae bacterium]|nr:hypothetical protein [Leptospiraceae bacterium]HMW03952.1 hypothetical protein [Leptospiraceae bacterium]HMX33590.1 hypothetical protein [Leptospiraceae bacterium]HMY29932.1 hypothetical protein [Leptospiraceae bacterium]HMZ67111.1 hypothetical protein [Leptospiraceae bacterium]
MILYTPTELRNNLFTTLDTVKRGETVCIKTREENLYIISEKQLERLKHSSKTITGSQKIKGRILGNLEEADKLLADYIILPK